MRLFPGLTFSFKRAIGLSAVPVTFLLVRRDELATAVASTSSKPQPAAAEV